MKAQWRWTVPTVQYCANISINVCCAAQSHDRSSLWSLSLRIPHLLFVLFRCTHTRPQCVSILERTKPFQRNVQATLTWTVKRRTCSHGLVDISWNLKCIDVCFLFFLNVGVCAQMWHRLYAWPPRRPPTCSNPRLSVQHRGQRVRESLGLVASGRLADHVPRSENLAWQLQCHCRMCWCGGEGGQWLVEPPAATPLLLWKLHAVMLCWHVQ